MLKRSAAFLLIIATVLTFSGNSYSSLKDFKDDVEKEEKENSSGSSSGGSSSSSDDESDAICSDACIELYGVLAVVWVVQNMSVSYLDYPYQKNDADRNYVIPHDINEDDSDTTGSVTKKADTNNRTEDKYTKPFYFTIEGGRQWCGDEGTAWYGAISGKFYKIIGPELEFKRTMDESDRLDYYAFGLNIPLFQFPGIIPDLYFQKAYMRGIIDRSGYALGVNVSIFPVRPLVLSARYGRQVYDEIYFHDYGCRIGIMLYRFQVFAGYRKIRAEYAKIGGFEAGLKLYF